MQLHYIHMDKCAGTSLQHFLRNLIPESQFLYGEHVSKDNKLNAIDCSMANLIHDPYGLDLSDLPWGVKSLLILRDPVERVFSHYKMITRWNPRELSRELRNTYKYAMKGILPFFQQKKPSINGALYNHYAYNLLGLRHLQTTNNLSFSWPGRNARNIYNSSEDFEKEISKNVLEILEKIDIIIDMDDLNVCAEMLGDALTQESVSIPFGMTLNKHNSSGKISNLSYEEKNILGEFTRIDQVIFDKAKELIGARQKQPLEFFKNKNRNSYLNISQEILAENIWPREVNYPKFAFWSSQGGKNSKIYISRNNISNGYLNIRVSNYLHDSQIHTAEIKVNGHEVILHKRHYPEGWLFLVEIKPAIIGESDLVEIEIIVKAIPAPDPNDPRELGLEISGISLIGTDC